MADVLHLMPRSTQQDWRSSAACTGKTEHFFAPHGEQAEARGIREAKAMAICRVCPVILDCRSYARTHRELGFWGGENDEQRQDARRRSLGRASPIKRTAAG
jgi:WhiB family redox-sensing transcriptional regulator